MDQVIKQSTWLDIVEHGPLADHRPDNNVHGNSVCLEPMLASKVLDEREQPTESASVAWRRRVRGYQRW